MTNITVETKSGADKLQKQLDTMADRIFARMIKATQRAGVELIGDLREATPEVTGALGRAWGKNEKVSRQEAIGTVVVGIIARWTDPATGKIPNTYATRVEEKSRQNKGFVARAFGTWKAGVVSKIRSEIVDEAAR
jgi:hypothetical protein